MSERVTLKDVARAAEVSQTTVSQYLSGDRSVCAPETAARIDAAVAQVGYIRRTRSNRRVEADRDESPLVHQPASAMPRRVAPRGSRTIGVCIAPSGDLLDPTRSSSSLVAEQVWNGAARAAEYEDYRLLSYPASVRNSTDIASFLDDDLAGLILVAGHGDPRPARLVEQGVPVVVLTRSLDLAPGCGAVYTHEGDTVELVMTHLWGIGHRRIAYYGGPVSASPEASRRAAEEGMISYLPSDIAVRRRDRYEAWMRHKESWDLDLAFCDSSWGGEHVEEALDRWLALPKPPTAVFCASDDLALQMMDVARRRGLSVPQDLSIVGVDDSPAAAQSNPPLASVALPAERLGREAVRQLIRMIDRVPGEECRVALPVSRLSLRESVVAPAQGGVAIAVTTLPAAVAAA